MRRKGIVEQLAEQRERALAFLEQGRQAREVAEILNVTACSVTRWRQEAQFLATQERLIVCWFSTAAPDLNPAEYI